MGKALIHCMSWNPDKEDKVDATLASVLNYLTVPKIKCFIYKGEWTNA